MENERYEYCLRFPASDWDRETARLIAAYLHRLEPDAEGNRPGVLVDEKLTGSLGIHVFPLNLYTQEQRDAIALECARIRNRVIARSMADTAAR